MTENPQKPGRWKNWLLIASLALNLAIIGLVAGFALRGDHGKRPHKGMPNDIVRDLVRAVPETQRDALKQDLAAKRVEIGTFRETMLKGRMELVNVLEAPDFDITRVVAILDNHRVVLSRITAGGHQVIIRRIEDMTADERRAFARNLERFQELRRSKPRN